MKWGFHDDRLLPHGSTLHCVRTLTNIDSLAAKLYWRPGSLRPATALATNVFAVGPKPIRLNAKLQRSNEPQRKRWEKSTAETKNVHLAETRGFVTLTQPAAAADGRGTEDGQKEGEGANLLVSRWNVRKATSPLPFNDAPGVKMSAAERSAMMSESGNGFMRGDSPSAMSPTPSAPSATNNANGEKPFSPNDAEARTVICANPEMAQIAAKVESIKNWTVSRFKTTKQSVFEQLGKVEKTIDNDMDNRIRGLHDLHSRYREVLSSAKAYATHYTAFNNAQRLLAESFYQLSLRELDLKQKLTDHSETLRQFCHHGDTFLRSINYFVSSLDTLCGKTIKDTLLTVQVYEHARLEYDAHRHELTLASQSPEPPKNIEEMRSKCETLRLRYEQLKEDVRVKLALLDENRLKVMQYQLSTFEKGLHQSFSESIRTLSSNSPTPVDSDSHFGNRGVASSFLEQ